MCSLELKIAVCGLRFLLSACPLPNKESDNGVLFTAGGADPASQTQLTVLRGDQVTTWRSPCVP